MNLRDELEEFMGQCERQLRRPVADRIRFGFWQSGPGEGCRGDPIVLDHARVPEVLRAELSGTLRLRTTGAGSGSLGSAEPESRVLRFESS